jgi:hypothetical protein
MNSTVEVTMHIQELVLDGVSYELNGYSLDGEQFTARWR